MRRVNLVFCVAVLLLAAIAVSVNPAWAQFPAPAPQQPQQPAQPQQPQQPVQPQQPAADPRAERIKGTLQQAGYRVYEVGFRGASGNTPPLWYASVAAQYTQPTGNALLKHSFDMWNALYGVVSQEPPHTAMVTGQAWTKYLIMVGVTVAQYTDLIARLRNAQSDADKNQVFNAFVRELRYGVLDTETRQWVDLQDFVNKNFAR